MKFRRKKSDTQPRPELQRRTHHAAPGPGQPAVCGAPGMFGSDSFDTDIRPGDVACPACLAFMIAECNRISEDNNERGRRLNAIMEFALPPTTMLIPREQGEAEGYRDQFSPAWRRLEDEDASDEECRDSCCYDPESDRRS